ncbi:MAG: KOW domain-containing RNA-binding protein [Oscillospiraceae bacterium]|nr:KOW domain-containing RNA-binding protein [Oscillospiraceae bacterium]
MRSLAGRDAGKFLCVTGESETAPLLCDGKDRPLARPKRKNPRHVQPLPGVALSPADLAGNHALRRALRRLEDQWPGPSTES